MKTASALIVAAALAAGYVQATSSGKFIFTCNALSSTFGCDPDGFDTYRYDFRGSQVRTNGATSRNGYCRERAGGPVVNASQEMHWAFKAVRSDNYRVVVTRGGDPESSPVTSYRPGELLDVHVRVMQGSAMAERDCAVPFRGTRRCYDFMDDNAAPFTQRPTAGDHRATAFRGLMMHFQQSSDANAPYSISSDGYEDPPRIDIPGDIGHAYFANATNGLDAPSVPGWELNGQEPPLFHLPSDSCGDEVLFHATGGYKATYNKFHYRAPAAGTGPLALRVLLKTGDANWGWFWFPNMAGDVVLSEGAEYTAPENNLEWVRGEVGQSCDDVCSAHTIDDEPTGCDEDAFDRISSPTSMMEVTAQGNPLVCQLPILSGCGALGPKTSSDGMCFYAEANCAADRDQAAPSCEAFSADPRQGRRLCPCNTETVNSASSAAPSVLIAAVAAVAALGSSSRMTLVIALALALAVVASPANAHNWLRSKSRAAFASTAAPFPPRTSDSPHVAVAFDQKFQVEWVTGHSRETYWVVCHASHAGKLKEIRDADMDQYLADRPASQANLHLDVSWRRWHRRRGTFTMDMTTYPSAAAYRPETTNDWRNADGTYDFRDFFESNTLDSNGPLPGQAADDRLPRSGAFSGSGAVSTGRGGVDTNTYYRQEYKDADLSLDARAKYTNPTWPWILEIVRCEHNANQASQPDVVNIAITMDASDPTRTPGPGHYMANWRWRGYYDMVDVDVRSGADVPLADVYGTPYTGGAPYRRMDHALFANTRQVWPSTMRDDTRCTVYHGSVEAAIRRCNRVGSTGVLACDGVNIWPLYVPSGVNSNLNTNGANGFNPMIPWNTNATYGCFEDDFIGAPAGTMVMAAVAARQSIDDRQPGIATTEDPEDLVFYSAIFAKDTGRNFSHVLQPGSPFLTSEPDLQWRYSHKCTQNCADLTAYEGFTVPPLGAKDEGCRNCEREPETPAVVYDGTPDSTEYFLNSRCGSDTLPGANMVDPVAPADYKLLAPRGSHREMLSSNTACAEMTKADPDCSEFYVRREGEDTEGGRVCFCLRNSAAPCDRVNDGSHTVFQINSAATAADPTCARGTLSTSRDRCCPASCSQADCDAGNGVCYTSNTNTLECTVRGAPCFFTNPLPAAPASNSTA